MDNHTWSDIFGDNRDVCGETLKRNQLFNILQLYHADEYLYNLYFRMKDEEQVVVGNFIFYSIENIVDIYCRNGILNENACNFARQFEIGMANIGMGHTCVLVYDPKVSKYYFRHGGGSDGNAGMYTYLYFNSDKFDPTSSEYSKYIFDFPSAIKLIITKRYGSFMLLDE